MGWPGWGRRTFVGQVFRREKKKNRKPYDNDNDDDMMMMNAYGNYCRSHFGADPVDESRMPLGKAAWLARIQEFLMALRSGGRGGLT